jgi:hypothetical protein
MYVYIGMCMYISVYIYMHVCKDIYIFTPKIWGIGNDADNYIGNNILSAILS